MEKKRAPVSYWMAAFGGGYLERGDPDFALRQGLSDTLHDHGLDRLATLVDPDHPNARIGGEPGWGIERQMLRGEVRRSEQRWRERLLRAGLDDQGQPLPDLPPTIRESNAKSREMGRQSMSRPLPTEELGPEAGWPAWARFKAELSFPDEFDNPEHPVVYYDAARIEQILSKVLAVYVQHHPESKTQAERILSHARWWAAHDAEHPPGDG